MEKGKLGEAKQQNFGQKGNQEVGFKFRQKGENGDEGKLLKFRQIKKKMMRGYEQEVEQ